MLRMVHAVLVLWLCELTCLASVSKVSFGSSNVGDECSARNQCVLSEDVGTSTPGNHAMPSYKLAWDGVAATDVELLGVTNLRLRADREARNVPHAWLSGVTDVELLRFLRAKHGHESEAWDMLLSHVEWRSSEFGADSAFTRNFFNNSPLHHEVFWMGLNKENCPTLVVRTQIHDGIYYNEDPRVFTRYISYMQLRALLVNGLTLCCQYHSFLVSVLEEGRRQYGVGIERPMCVLIDRAGTVYRNGKKKIEKFDMAVIPNLLELFRHMYSTFTVGSLHTTRISFVPINSRPL